MTDLIVPGRDAPAADVITPTVRTPAWGTRSDQLGAVRAGLIAAAAVALYIVAAHRYAPAFVPTDLEVLGTWSSLACVWLTRRQNVLSMPYGITSVVLMGIFFFDIELVGQGWLHLGFYIPVQFVGWWIWIRGGTGRTDLPVGWLSWRDRAGAVVAVAAGTVLLAWLFGELHGPTPYPLWDSEIVAASVAAQLLLITKRVESWFVWLIPIDVAAIGLYLRTDATMFAALYALYLVIATAGLVDWVKAHRAQREGLTAFEARHVT